MNTAVMKRTAPVGRDTSGNGKTIMEDYSKHPGNASREQRVVEKQLGWALLTLRNPKIRPSERECVLDLIGQILLGFLSQQYREAVA